MLFIFKFKLWFFNTVYVQYFDIWKKLILCVMVVLPSNYTYIILILFIVLGIIESFLPNKANPDDSMLNRTNLYKLLEFIVIFLCGIYAIVELNVN